MANDTNSLLRKVINGQSAMKSELLSKIDGVENRLDTMEKNLNVKIDGVEARLTKGVDRIGKSLTYLEDDTPTIEEFDKLKKRVTKVEQKVATV